MGLPTLLFYMGKVNLDEIKEKVRVLIEPIIEDLGMGLDDIELSMMGGKALLRIFIDREQGVTIDDCEEASHAIEAVLDVEDPIPYTYVLEVSSPGLDRPLRTPGDFKRFTGSNARVVTHEPIGKQTFFVGIITEAGDDGIVLMLPKEKKVAIPYNNISRARLEVEV